MINVERINSLVDSYIKENGIFIVDSEVRKGNHIRVYIDSLDGVTIEECAKVSRIIESGLDREIEDFDLEVSSPGLDAPLKVYPQYYKNVGRDVEIIRTSGIKIKGKLTGADKQGISIEVSDDKSNKADKTEKHTIRKEHIPFSDIKMTRLVINF
jgi:ribosome maturation factor RimP